MSTIASHRTIAALKLPTQIPSLISLAKGIVQAMTGNTSFPTPEPPLATVTAAISDLETAEVAAQARTKGAATTRNQKRAALVMLLEQLKAYVQKTADGNTTESASLIQSAAMSIRKTAVHPKRVFDATQGTVSGSVKLVTNAAARRASYEWQYSADGGKTWQVGPATLQAETTVTGLQPGTSYMFRYRSIIKTGTSDWSQTISLIVK